MRSLNAILSAGGGAPAASFAIGCAESRGNRRGKRIKFLLVTTVGVIGDAVLALLFDSVGISAMGKVGNL